ncbi:MAG: BatD family protein, partial [Fusobacteriaceae bacterium]
MKKIKLLILFLIFTVSTFSEIILTSTESRIDLNETVEISVDFNNIEKKQYVIQGLDNFQILSKSSSSSYSIINFKRSSIIKDIYTLRPKSIGNFNLIVEMMQEKSNNVEIEVEENNKNIVTSEKTKENLNDRKENYILMTDFPKNKLYFGEKFVYQETFFAFRNLRDFQVVKRPELSNFSVKDLTPVLRNGSLEIKNINYQGENALEIVVYRGILDSNSSGKKIIKSGEIEILGEKRLFLGNESVEIDILPLPVENKPKKFTNIVGKLKMESSPVEAEINLGESYTVNLKLFGDVNLSLFEKLDIPNSGDIQNFQNVTNVKEEIKNGEYYSEKNFEIAFIPKKSGDIKIPEIKINYFDTETQKYSEIILPGKTIKVKGDNIVENSIKKSKEDIGEIENKEEIEESLPIKIEIVGVQEKYGEKIYWISGLLLLLVLIQSGVIFYLLTKNKKTVKKNMVNSFKQLKKSKTEHEFYSCYCEFMKEKYGFNPKVHSEIKLINEELKEINREIELSRF